MSDVPGCGHVADCEACRAYVLDLIRESATWTAAQRAAVKSALGHLEWMLAGGSR